MICEVESSLSLVRLEPLLQLIQRLAPMANLVLLALIHFRIRLALVLKARVPAYTRTSVSKTTPKLAFAVTLLIFSERTRKLTHRKR